MNQRISFREILENSNDIHIFEKAFDSYTQSYFSIEFNSIPKEYLPFSDSFCPEEFSITQTNLSYSLHLTGLEADLHRIKPSTMAKICNNFEKLIKNLLSPILANCKSLGGQSYVTPNPIGSFNINFNISLKHEPNLLNYRFDHDSDTKEILDQFMKYCFSDLASEIEQLIQGTLPHKFEMIKQGFEVFLQKYTINFDPEKLLSDLKTKAITSPEIIFDLTEEMGKDFNKIEVFTPLPLAEIDTIIQEKISGICSKIESLTTTTDENESEFDIHIYQLNVESCKGKANIRVSKDSDKLINVSLKILGTDTLGNTKYTSSIHENKFITVKAKAKRSKGIIKSLDVVFEPN
ncbi:MAG: hypothetical protein V1897_12525 [Pseudomonadota bacterium]